MVISMSKMIMNYGSLGYKYANSAGFSCATRLKQSLGQKPEFAMQISR